MKQTLQYRMASMQLFLPKERKQKRCAPDHDHHIETEPGGKSGGQQGAPLETGIQLRTEEKRIQTEQKGENSAQAPFHPTEKQRRAMALAGVEAARCSIRQLVRVFVLKMLRPFQQPPAEA